MQRHQANQLQKQLISSGFTLTESLVAGVILFLLMLGTNRFLFLGIANSSQSGERAALEMEILNDIEKVHQLDALLQNSNELKPLACSSGNAAQHLDDLISLRNPVLSSNDWSRQSDSTNPNILVLIYSFETPKSKEKSKEYRIVELHPSFMAMC